VSADFDAQGLALAARAETLRQRQSLTIYNRPALRAWHAALADRASAPARAVWLGDSITEGLNAASYGTRWVERALARLRLDHPTAGVAGGSNYLPCANTAFTQGSTPPQGQPYTALTGGALAFDTSWGLGGRSVVLNANGDGATYTVQATSVTLHYVRGPGTGTMSVSIDGGAATLINTAGALGMQQWSSGALGAGSHTVAVTRSAGGSVYFAGLLVFNGDEAAGVQGYDAGHFGWNSTQYAAAQGGTWASLGLIAPQLVTVALGTNDYQSQTTIATFRANLASIIGSIRTQAANASIALIMYGRRGDLAVQPIGWRSYVDAAYAVADADVGMAGASGVAVIDLSGRLPDAAIAGTVDPLGLFAADRVHLSAKGHAMVGEMVAGALRM
jgi:lysophospholipase L1-like esterase